MKELLEANYKIRLTIEKGTLFNHKKFQSK